jgi:hypothetical protein
MVPFAAGNRSVMPDWKSYLAADPTDWLLGQDNPSVRYFTLTDILNKASTDPQVPKAKQEIMLKGAAPKILAKQEQEGYWVAPDRFYTAKYQGTVWQLIILAELGADGGDERIKKACELMLEKSQDPASGAFSMHESARIGGGRRSEVIPCLTGNMVWSLIRLGYLEDPRVQQGIDWIVKYQRFDDGSGVPPKEWPYDRYEICWGKHVCHMGVVKTLKALAEIPADQRSADVQRKIEEASEYLLKHNIYRRSHDLSKTSKPGWLRFSFPLMYQTDVLEILGILTRLGYGDDRMQEAVDAVVARQNEEGKWLLKGNFPGRFAVDIEKKDEPSKWITLNALRVLKRYYG